MTIIIYIIIVYNNRITEENKYTIIRLNSLLTFFMKHVLGQKYFSQ